MTMFQQFMEAITTPKTRGADPAVAPAGYPDDYAQEPDNPGQVVQIETATLPSNFDPGTGNIGGPSYTGMPDKTVELIRPPMTFEQANPDLQYTNAQPYGPVARVKKALAPTWRARNYILNPAGTASYNGPVMVLAKNPRRVGAILSHNATTIVIADDPAALSTLSATNYGDGFILPPLPFTIPTTAEVYAACTSGTAVVLSVLELIDL